MSCFGRYSGKKLVKMGSENGRMLKTETEVDFSPEVSFFSLNFSCFGRYSGKKLVKMGSENGKNASNGNGS